MTRKLSAYNKFVKAFAKSHKGSPKSMMKAAGAAWRKSGKSKSPKKSKSHSPKKSSKSKKCPVGSRRTSLRKKSGKKSKRSKCSPYTKKMEKMDEELEELEEKIEEAKEEGDKNLAKELAEEAKQIIKKREKMASEWTSVEPPNFEALGFRIKTKFRKMKSFGKKSRK